jgi:hypothetical protein
MSSRIERILGVTDTTFYEATVTCLKEIGAIRPSKAVSTEKLAKALTQRGLKRPIEDIGEMLGSYEMMTNGQMRFLAHRVAKDPKDWRGYEWFVNLPTDDPFYEEAHV